MQVFFLIVILKWRGQTFTHKGHSAVVERIQPENKHSCMKSSVCREKRQDFNSCALTCFFFLDKSTEDWKLKSRPAAAQMHDDLSSVSSVFSNFLLGRFFIKTISGKRSRSVNIISHEVKFKCAFDFWLELVHKSTHASSKKINKNTQKQKHAADYQQKDENVKFVFWEIRSSEV